MTITELHYWLHDIREACGGCTKVSAQYKDDSYACNIVLTGTKTRTANLTWSDYKAVEYGEYGGKTRDGVKGWIIMKWNL